MSAAVLMYELLEDLAAEGRTLPKGSTGRVKVDKDLVLHVADETDLNAGLLYLTFRGLAVRQLFAITRWARREAPDDLEEQQEMLARWGAKHNPPKRRERSAA